MTGKAYYITTLADWHRHASRFAHSHYIVLDADKRDGFVGAPLGAPQSVTTEISKGAASSAPTDDATGHSPACSASTKILVLVEADEGAHLALEDDPAFEALPHPLAQAPISAAAQAALAPHGVGPGATTFDAAEALARVHPLLKHRVF